MINKNRNHIIICAITATSLIQLAITSYIPLLTKITSILNTSQQMVKLSVTMYFLGYGLFSLLYGWLSDIYGRRFILLLSLLLFISVSISGLIITSAFQLILVRFLQGATLTAIDAIFRGILCDHFSEQDYVKYSSYIFMTFPIMMFIGPLIGGVIISYINWKLIFIFLSFYALLVIFIIRKFLKIPLSSSKITHKHISLSQFLKNLKTVIANPLFKRFLFAGIAANSGEIAYNISLPYILFEQHGVEPLAYGALVGSFSLSVLLGAICINVSSRFFTTKQGALFGLLICLIAGLCLLAGFLLHVNTIITILIPIFFFVLGAQIIYANANAGAIAPFSGYYSGFAGGLQNSLQTITASCIGMMIAILPIKSILILAIHFILAILIAGLYLVKKFK